MIWIAIDAMGGDHAPGVVVDGALAAVRHFDLGVILVGPVDRLETELARHGGADRARIRLLVLGWALQLKLYRNYSNNF
jgi:glycerol-3-phosphate acyltransferase PlsX